MPLPGSPSLMRMVERQRETNPQNINTVVKDTIISIIVRLINSKAGGFIQAGVGSLLGFIVTAAAKHGFSIPESVVADWRTALMATGALAVTSGVQYLQNLQVKKVQEALGVKQDGVIGPVTIRKATLAD